MTVTMSLERSLKQELDGNELRNMFEAATSRLAGNEESINKLNVFPVPDGDTGTNMLLTMQSVMKEVEKCRESGVSANAGFMAKGALMGARGNSGVILSQIMKGFAAGLAGKDEMTAAELAEALGEASKAAYAALSQPREGTMLTVIKDAASAAVNNLTGNENDITGLMEIIVEETRNSVERTPLLLDVLRDAGVVDAGGQGIYIILEGILCYLKGEDIDTDITSSSNVRVERPVSAPAGTDREVDEAYGYCTELILRGSDLRQEQIRRWVESQGKSALVVGDEENIKIHVHTFHPGTIIEFALSLGTVHDLKIENMDEQHNGFIRKTGDDISEDRVAVIAVVAGDGLQEVFRDLGVSAIIPGGQTMNPSCSDFLRTIESSTSENVIILPNNKNVIPAARQAAEFSDKSVKVLPTRSVPQGLAAMISFDSRAGLDENAENMSGFKEQVHSIEITAAVRNATVNGIKIGEGDCMGIVDDEVVFAGESIEDAVFQSLEAAGAGNAGIITLFYGEQVESDAADGLGNAVGKRYPGSNVEIIRGAQPHYSYIISVEF